MTRAAGLRRSRMRSRVLATAAALCAALGASALGLGAAPTLAAPPSASQQASDSPYPPTTPCSLSWAPAGSEGSSAGRPVLVGSGLGAHQHVDVVLYPQSRMVGSYATDASGGFATPVTLPDASSTSWLTASSAAASCSTPARPARDVGGTSPAPRTGASSGTPTPAVPSSGVEPTSITAPPATPTGQARRPLGSGTGAPGSDYPPYPPTPNSSAPTGSTVRASGAGSRSTASGSTTSGAATAGVPTSPGRPSSSPPQSLSAPALGVPLSIILGLAVLLVVAGGTAVLILTRRSS